MATATFSLDNFKSEVFSGKGLARTNRFEISIEPNFVLSGDGSNTRLASLYVEQASIPLLNIATKPFKIFGPSQQRPITSEYGGEGLSVNFHVDREMSIKRYFEDWMHRIVDPVNFYVSYQAEYTATLKIRQLDESNTVTYEIEVLEAFPRNMNIMELNNASTNQTHRLNILFAYRYWRQPVTTQATAVPSRVSTNPEIIQYGDYRQFNPVNGNLENVQGSDLPISA